jgi:hypothetical protein
MKKKMVYVLAGLIDAEELRALNIVDEKKGDTSDNQAFYFLSIMLIMIVTFSMFKGEILHMLF